MSRITSKNIEFFPKSSFAFKLVGFYYATMSSSIIGNNAYLQTILIFAWIHANRKVFSNVKEVIVEEWTPSFRNATYNRTLPDVTWNDHCLFQDSETAEYFLGTLDTAFMFAYAFGLYISGIVGDIFDLRKVLAVGMWGSAIAVFLFGAVSEWTHTYNIGYYLVFWALAGLLQSSQWPGMVAVMGNWFGKSSRGTVLGLWSSCASIGNIIGSLIVAKVVIHGYEYAFLVPSLLLFCWGVFIICGLVPHPREVGLSAVDEEVIQRSVDSEPSDSLLSTNAQTYYGSANQEVPEEPIRDKQEFLHCWRAWLLPGVIPYSLAYASLKFVNYAFFFWLPYYLTQAYGWTQSDSDELSIWYDVGGIIGGITAGFITDRLKIRAPIMVGMLLIGAPCLYFYSISPAEKAANATLLAVLGFFVGGPSNIISSAISADIGKQAAIMDNKQAISTVAGIIDGTGSVGAAIGQVLVPVISNAFGWHVMFYVFIALMLVTAACITPVCVHEVKSTLFWRRRFGRSGIAYVN